jgi:hypothetical protein
VYVHELAAELGVEPRDVIDLAALAGFGLVNADTFLTPDQITTLRLSAPSSAAFANGGALPPSAFSFDTGGASAGGSFSGPLGFAPPGTTPPPTSAPPAEKRWDEEPLWEPLTFGGALDPSTVTIDDTGVHYGEPAATPVYNPPPPEVDISRFRAPPPPLPIATTDHTKLRKLAIGVVGLLVIIFGARFVGEQLDIIGPGAERHCTLTTKPFEGGEGMIEELVCLDGRGKEVSREVRVPDSTSPGIEFGTAENGDTTRIIDLPEFCRGATNFEDFRSGLSDQLTKADSMAPVGNWYDENDGYGSGGLGTMLETFGNAGPNPQLTDLHQYLADVEEAVRSNSLEGARMLVAASEVTHEPQLRALRTITLNQC